MFGLSGQFFHAPSSDSVPDVGPPIWLHPRWGPKIIPESKPPPPKILWKTLLHGGQKGTWFPHKLPWFYHIFLFFLSFFFFFHFQLVNLYPGKQTNKQTNQKKTNNNNILWSCTSLLPLVHIPETKLCMGLEDAATLQYCVQLLMLKLDFLQMNWCTS